MDLPNQEQINSFVEQMKPAAEKFAETLSITTQEIWRIGILKQYVDGALMLMGGLVILGITIYILIKIRKITEILEEEVWVLVLWLGAIAGMVALFYYGLLHIVVPQYTLIMEIIGLVK